jgi:hypothetical protein
MPRQKKIIVGNIYREWQHMGQGPGNTTGSVASQLQHWLTFIDMWGKVLREGKEVMVLGDINLDFLKWTMRNLPANDSSSKLKQLDEDLFVRIFPLGVVYPPSLWPGPHTPTDRISAQISMQNSGVGQTTNFSR